MKSVAFKTNVSTVAVSRALTSPDRVSQATRNQAEQTALEVDYLPQPLRQNMKRNESRAILVIMPDICDPSLSEVIRGIEVTAAEHGYLVLVGNCAHQGQKEKAFTDLTITGQIDGMVLLNSCLLFDASMEEWRNLPPMVMSNKFTPELGLPTAHIDNLTAAFNTMNYLHELEYQHIGCIAGPENMSLYYYHLQGYVRALRRSGITADPHYIARDNFTSEAGANMLGQLLSQPVPPVAVFCHSDVMALGALSLAKYRGLKVSDDLSIAGFDNIALPELCDLPLATVSQPRFDIGHEGMLPLLEQMQGHNVNSGPHLLGCELIVRGSTQEVRR